MLCEFLWNLSELFETYALLRALVFTCTTHIWMMHLLIVSLIEIEELLQMFVCLKSLPITIPNDTLVYLNQILTSNCEIIHCWILFLEKLHHHRVQWTGRCHYKLCPPLWRVVVAPLSLWIHSWTGGALSPPHATNREYYCSLKLSWDPCLKLFGSLQWRHIWPTVH